MRSVIAVSVLAALVSGASVAVAVDARSEARAAKSVRSGHSDSLATQLAQLRRRVARDEGAVDGDNPGPATLTPLQQDVRDVGHIIQQYGGGQGEPTIRRALNELLAICRGSAVLYTEADLHAPACPDDI